MCLVVLLIANPALGQLGMGQHGKKIYQEMDIEFSRGAFPYETSCTPLSEEDFACVWSQTDFDGIRRVHLQIASNDRRPYSPALSLDNHCKNAVICRGPNGGAYVAWAERLDDDQWRIMLQRVNSNGSPAWQQGGIEVTEVTNDHTPEFRVYLSSDGNCFVGISDNSRDSHDIVFAFDQSGDGMEGWPLQGYEIRFTTPDDDGGFWFRQGGNSLYNVSRNGRIVGGRPLILAAPGNGYRIMWHRGLPVHDGIQIGTGHIFAVWVNGINAPTIVGVYDFAGQLERFDTLLDPYNNEAADFLSMRHLVTSDNRLVAVYNHIDHHRIYGNGEWFEDPIYAPRVICYAPFEDNRFPFRWRGRISIGTLDTWAEEILIYQVGENYLVGNYPFDHIGQQLWEGNYPPRFGSLYPIGDIAWVFGGSPYFAYQINNRGVRENENEVTGLVPHLRERGRTFVFPTTNGGCDVLMVDKYRGLTCQYVNTEGHLSSSLAAEVLEPLWKYSSYNRYSSGMFANSHWSSVAYPTEIVNLVVSDNNGNGHASISHDLSADGIWGTNYTSPVGNGHDRLLSVLRNDQDGGMRLIEFNSMGEVTRNVDRDLEIPKLLDYWQGQGWLYIDRASGSDMWRANLIDDDLNIRWRRELDFNPAQIAFHDTTAVMFWINGWTRMLRTEIGASSTIIRSDSLFFFDREILNGTTSGKLQMASDGGWWLLADSYSRLQKIRSDGTKVYGANGLVIPDRIYRNRLLPDTEGGAYLIWEAGPVRMVKVIHFDTNGDKVGDNYPDDGLDIFDSGWMSLEDAVYDPNSGNVWVTAEQSVSSNGDVVSRELWVQLVGDNVVGVPNVDPTRVYDFSLSPAYPNPFNATTTIPFSLPDRASVSLRIYDLNGRLVQDLSPPGSLNSGQHEIVWNAPSLSTGIYFVRLESGEKSAVRRTFLLK